MAREHKFAPGLRHFLLQFFTGSDLRSYQNLASESLPQFPSESSENHSKNVSEIFSVCWIPESGPGVEYQYHFLCHTLPVECRSHAPIYSELYFLRYLDLPTRLHSLLK